jgi:hypothetical protein
VDDVLLFMFLRQALSRDPAPSNAHPRSFQVYRKQRCACIGDVFSDVVSVLQASQRMARRQQDCLSRCDIDEEAACTAHMQGMETRGVRMMAYNGKVHCGFDADWTKAVVKQ